MSLVHKTIFALSSGVGKAGVAVIRVTGPESFALAQGLIRKPLPEMRKATFCRFYHPDGDEIDRGLLLVFQGPQSFSGEDCAEFQVHGGRAVIARLCSALHELGARPAEAGEFSRRAFENGKLDLVEAEALADLIDAETEGQRKQAVRQMEGSLGRLYEGWRKDLLHCLALFEAEIDFSDEDLPEDLSEQTKPLLPRVLEEIDRHLDDHHRGERLRDGVRVAIIGAPNVGKSSLINALVKRDVAIVSDISGTTRDVIEVHLDLAGIPVILADTAGLRQGADKIEEEGIKRAILRAEQSDFRLLVLDVSQDDDVSDTHASLLQDGDIVVGNKVDLINPSQKTPSYIPISAKTGAGLDVLIDCMTENVVEAFALTEAPALTRTRHRQALKDASDALHAFQTSGITDISLRAEDLRIATRCLGRITGRVDVEDMLDLIFSEFCIGK